MKTFEEKLKDISIVYEKLGYAICCSNKPYYIGEYLPPEEAMVSHESIGQGFKVIGIATFNEWNKWKVLLGLTPDEYDLLEWYYYKVITE